MADPRALMTDAEWWAFLHAPCTYVYDCTVNCYFGFACTLFVAERATVEFPTRALPA